METWERELAEKDRMLAVVRQQLSDREGQLSEVRMRLVDEQTAFGIVAGVAIVLGIGLFFLLGAAIQSGILE